MLTTAVEGEGVACNVSANTLDVHSSHPRTEVTPGMELRFPKRYLSRVTEMRRDRQTCLGGVKELNAAVFQSARSSCLGGRASTMRF
jgi:hypothetical protein